MKDPLTVPVPVPTIQQHAVIGDRRTAALVAADGTIPWWCLSEFDGPPMFAALLNGERGGFCGLGPAVSEVGQQAYLPKTTALVTRWPETDERGGIEVTDLMAWPEDDAKRPEGTRDQRIVLRRLRVTGKSAALRFQLEPRWNFSTEPAEVQRFSDQGVTLVFEAGTFGLWTTFPVAATATGASAGWTMRTGEEHWAVLGWNTPLADWSVARAEEVFAGAVAYWQDWASGLDVSCAGECADAAERSALTVQVLSHAHHGSTVAAVTTSLPERLGGDRNYDYRYAWVRDGSLALALLARLGKAGEVRRYLDWLGRLESETDAPLQVVYGIDGRTAMAQQEVRGVRGYAESLPVLTGNHAATQRQLGSFAFLTDCIHLYLEHGGELQANDWQLIRRAAEYTCRDWRKPGSGIWELSQQADYVESRVLAWVVLERAICIAGHTGYGDATQLENWRDEMARIHAEVMDQGWSEKKGAFRQRYGSEALDAAALLIPLMRFLPADHPRVVNTVAALERELVVDGLLHRFDPADTLGGEQPPLGQFEGAFLPCVFWHAHTLAIMGRVDEARALLDRCDRVAGEPGLFAEELGSKLNIFLGNTPLLFSHVEYVRAAIAINQASQKR